MFLISHFPMPLAFLLLITLCSTSTKWVSAFDPVISFSVSENLPENTQVGVLGAEYSTYEEISENDYIYFKKQSDSVELLTRQPLDREKCPGKFTDSQNCVIEIPFLYGRDLSGFKTISVTITDEDDNEPKFNRKFQKISIPENAAIGSEHLLEQAADPDLPQNGVIDYVLHQKKDIMDDFEKFGVKKVTREVDGAIMPRLVLTGELDYEEVKNYSLELVAVGKKHNATLPITVLIQDVNDNSPEFGQSFIQVLIPEDTPVGAVVSRIVATDTDSGLNGQVEFVFSEESIEESTGYFEIGRDSGEIRLKKPLFNKGGTKHSISIIARDKGEKPLQDVMTWNFEIQDLNDFSPKITFRPMTDCYENGSVIYVPENLGNEENGGKNHMLGIFKVEDEDKGAFGMTELFLHNGTELFDLVPIGDQKTYLFKQKNSFDREQEPNKFILHFSAHDCAIEGTSFGVNDDCSRLTTHQNFEFRVADENDNWPRFEEHSYESTLTEEQSPKNVKHLRAVDEDSGPNGQIVYSINSKTTPSNYFRIDPNTGWIEAVSPLDREILGSDIEVTVRASDRGNPPKYADTKFYVHLRDINDNPPKFKTDNSQIYQLVVEENREKGESIGIIQAEDPDSQNASVTYSYSNFHKRDPELFVVDWKTGSVSATRSFDFETLNRDYPEYRQLGCFRFLAIATEETNDLDAPFGHDGSNEITVEVRVLDMNDNVPIVDFSKTETNVVIPWDAYKGYEITKILASDPDNSSELSYVINDELLKQRFGVNQNTGAIYANEDLGLFSENLEEDQDFLVTVQISDSVHEIPVQISIRLSSNWTLFNHSLLVTKDDSFAELITEVPKMVLYLTSLIIFIVLTLMVFWAVLIIKFRGSPHRRMRVDKKRNGAPDVVIPYHHTHHHHHEKALQIQYDSKRGTHDHSAATIFKQQVYKNGKQSHHQRENMEMEAANNPAIPLRNTFNEIATEGLFEHQGLNQDGIVTKPNVYTFQGPQESQTISKGRKHSRSPPVVEYGDHREPDFWLPRSLESRKPMNNREAENGVETTFMRVQKPVNMYSQNQRSHSGAETIVVTTTCQAPNTSPRDDRDSPNSSSGGILINPSNQILQPPSSGHEKWNLPRENSFRHSQAMNHPNTCPRNRTSIDLDTIDEDLQSINTPSTLPDLCKDAHHSSLEKQSYNRHSSLPSNPTSLFVNNSNDNPKQLTSVCKTAIV